MNKKLSHILRVTTLVPAHKHGDASPEYIEPSSLLFHQHTASPAKRPTWVSHVLATKACVFLLHHYCLLLLLLVLLVMMLC